MALSDFAAPITRARNGGLLVGKEAAEQQLAAQGRLQSHTALFSHGSMLFVGPGVI